MFGFTRREKLIKAIELSDDKLKENINKIADQLLDKLVNMLLDVFKERLNKISSSVKMEPEKILKIEFESFLEQSDLAYYNMTNKMEKHLKVESDVANKLGMKDEYNSILNIVIQQRINRMRIEAEFMFNTRMEEILKHN